MTITKLLVLRVPEDQFVDALGKAHSLRMAFAPNDHRLEAVDSILWLMQCWHTDRDRDEVET